MSNTKTEKTNWTNSFDGFIIESKFNEIFNDPTLARFIAYAQLADNWDGKPHVGCGIFKDGPVSREDFVANMKTRGWITTAWDDTRNANWITFTESGVKVAAEYGVVIEVTI